LNDYQIISLSCLLEQKDDVTVEEFLSRFNCEKEPDVQSFLRENAISFEKRHLSRTYLLVREICEDKPLELIAYFSVAI